MSATSITLRGRVAAERNMLDAVTIQHQTGTTSDPETGVTTPTYSTIYTGKAKIQTAQFSGSPSDVGEASVIVSQLQVHVPVAATGITSEDVVTVTASALDPDLVGKTFRIRGPSHKSYLTARRFSVIEVTS